MTKEPARQELALSHHKNHYILDFSLPPPYNKPIFFLSNQKHKTYYHNKKSITISVSHSAGENDRYKYRTVTKKIHANSLEEY